MLILGTAANIYAEEAYSETHSDPVLPPSLKEIEDSFMNNQQNALPNGSNSVNQKSGDLPPDLLSMNRLAHFGEFKCYVNPVCVPLLRILVKSLLQSSSLPCLNVY